MSAPRQEEGWTPRWLSFSRQLSFASRRQLPQAGGSQRSNLVLDHSVSPVLGAPVWGQAVQPSVLKKMPSIVYICFFGGFEGHWLLRAPGVGGLKQDSMASAQDSLSQDRSFSWHPW